MVARHESAPPSPAESRHAGPVRDHRTNPSSDPRLASQEVGESLRETELKGFKRLRCRIEKEARPGDGDKAAELLKFVDRSRAATDRRNELLHGFWCKRDGVPAVRIERGEKPRASDL